MLRASSCSTSTSGWAWFVIIGNGLAGAVGARRPTGCPWLRTRALWWFTGVVELDDLRAGRHSASAWWPAQKFVAPKFHMFYGFVAIIAVGDHLLATATQMRSRLYLLYGLGGLFLMGLGIRAMLVGQTGATLDPR